MISPTWAIASPATLDDVQYRTMSQFNIQVGDIMGKLELFLSLTVGLALLVGGVGIANTMLMSAMERIVEFGVMRANGWTRRNILGLVTIESGLLGLLSGILASILAFAGVIVLNHFLTQFELQLELTPGLILASTLTAILIAVARGPLPRLARFANDAHGRNSQRGVMSNQAKVSPSLETRATP